MFGSARTVSEYWAPPHEEAPRMERVYDRMQRHLLAARINPVAVVAKSHNDNVVLYVPEPPPPGTDAATQLHPLWLTLDEERKAEQNAAAAARGRPVPHATVDAVRLAELSRVERAAFGAQVARGRTQTGAPVDVVTLGVGDLPHPIHLVRAPDGDYALTTVIANQPARLESLYAQMRASCTLFPSVEYLTLRGTALHAPHAEVEEQVPVDEDRASAVFSRLLGFS